MHCRCSGDSSRRAHMGPPPPPPPPQWVAPTSSRPLPPPPQEPWVVSSPVQAVQQPMLPVQQSPAVGAFFQQADGLMRVSLDNAQIQRGLGAPSPFTQAPVGGGQPAAFGGACLTMEVRASFAVQAVMPVPVQQAPPMLVQEIEDEENPWDVDQPASAVGEVSHEAMPASTVPEVDFWQVGTEPLPVDAVPAVQPAQDVAMEEQAQGNPQEEEPPEHNHDLAFRARMPNIHA